VRLLRPVSGSVARHLNPRFSHVVLDEFSNLSAMFIAFKYEIVVLKSEREQPSGFVSDIDAKVAGMAQRQTRIGALQVNVKSSFVHWPVNCV
jgi:hypothetical protein